MFFFLSFNNVIIQTPGLQYTNGGNILLINPGLYKITYHVHADNNNAMALTLNNNLINDSVYATQNGDRINIGMAIISAPANSILNLRNVNNTNMTIPVINVGNLIAVNVSLIIERFV